MADIDNERDYERIGEIHRQIALQLGTLNEMEKEICRVRCELLEMDKRVINQMDEGSKEINGC